MSSMFKKAAAGVAALAALALGGAAVAGATTSGTSSSGSGSATTTTSTAAGGSRPAFNGPAPGTAAHENAEKPVTGDVATKAQAAAVKSVGSGTAGPVTTDLTGQGYETTVTKSDGSKVEVHLDHSLKVMTHPGGPGHGPGGAGPGPGVNGSAGPPSGSGYGTTPPAGTTQG